MTRFTRESIEDGQEFGVEFDLTPELVAELTWGVDEASPWYRHQAPFRRLLAPPYLLSHRVAWVTLDRVGPGTGQTHAGSDPEPRNPVSLGCHVRLEEKIVDKLGRRRGDPRGHAGRHRVLTDRGPFGAE